MTDSPGLITKQLTIKEIVDDNHLFTQDIDGIEYYLGVVNKPNNVWIDNTYHFKFAQRDYASAYKKNSLGNYTFLYSLTAIKNRIKVYNVI